MFNTLASQRQSSRTEILYMAGRQAGFMDYLHHKTSIRYLVVSHRYELMVQNEYVAYFHCESVPLTLTLTLTSLSLMFEKAPH